MPRVALDARQLNGDHPFVVTQLQSADDRGIVIQSDGHGRRHFRLGHLDSPRFVQSTKDTRPSAAACPHRISYAEGRELLLEVAARVLAASIRMKESGVFWYTVDISIEKMAGVAIGVIQLGAIRICVFKGGYRRMGETSNI